MADLSAERMIGSLYCRKAHERMGGLGNRLFPWARCRIFTVATGVPMLAPIWSSIPAGTILRREPDWRTYHDLFHPSTDQVRGVKAAFIRGVARKLPETEKDGALDARGPRPTLIDFRGYEGYFQPILGSQDFLRAELRAITKPRWLAFADLAPRATIGIHVRSGDFVLSGMHTPVEWFISSLEAAREIAGKQVGAIVFSDYPDRLGPLGTMPGVQIVETGSSVSDLLALSRCDMILGSSYSTFSGWAAFLRQIPLFCHAEDGLTSMGLAPTDEWTMGILDPKDPSETFQRAVVQEMS